MRTVQEWLREADEEALADEYFSLFPIDYERKDLCSKTVEEIRAAARGRFISYIRRLREVEVKQQADGDTGIFYAAKTYADYGTLIKANLCIKKELLESAEPESYAYELTEQAELMGYLVAETPLTLKNMDTVLANILYEASFFGYEQEKLTDAISRLKEAEKDIEAGNVHTCSMEELFGEDYAKDKDEKEETLNRAMVQAQIDYCLYCRRKEEATVRKLVLSVGK